MAKPTKDQELSQMNLFPYDPAVKNLGLVDVKLKGGALDITMIAATEAADLAMIRPEQWAKAASEWLVRLCGGNDGLAEAYLNHALSNYADEVNARENDEAMGFARNRRDPVVVRFGDSAG